MPGVFPHSLIIFWSFKLGNKAKPPSSCNNNNNNSSNTQQPPGVLSTWLFSVLLLHNRETVIQAWKYYNNSIEISKLNIWKPDLWRREVFSCCCCFIWSKFFCFVIHHFRFLIKNSEREERTSDSVIFYLQQKIGLDLKTFFKQNFVIFFVQNFKAFAAPFDQLIWKKCCQFKFD